MLTLANEHDLLTDFPLVGGYMLVSFIKSFDVTITVTQRLQV
jgi:hypothetical protein